MVQHRESSQIELAAFEAINKAIETGFIDIRPQQAENIIEGLYMLLNQYKEENDELKAKLQIIQDQRQNIIDELEAIGDMEARIMGLASTRQTMIRELQNKLRKMTKKNDTY